MNHSPLGLSLLYSRFWPPFPCARALQKSSREAPDSKSSPADLNSLKARPRTRTETVYLTGRGVTVFDKSGNQIEHIDVPEPWTANITFGGKDRDLLFITASKNVYGLNMRVKGAQ